MKNKFLNFFKLTLVLSTMLLFSNSCTTEKWYNETQIDNTFFTINQNQWTWNSSKDRYEYASPFRLSQDEYNNGVFSASVFVIEDGLEVQAPLPYIKTWSENTNNGTAIYTETLSFDVSQQDGSVLFYIQASDLGKTNQNNIPDYEIKVSLIYYL